jgi:hypothetical protein
MNLDPKASLEYLLAFLQAHNPELLAVMTAVNVEEFSSAVEQGLDRAIVVIESGAKRYSGLDERALSRLLADLIAAFGFNAAAERDSNGHCDLVVEHLLRKQWRYLGECKIHRTPKYHESGCEQVLGYCGGQESRAFCLDFFKKAGMQKRLALVRTHFDSKLPLKQVEPSKERLVTKGAFTTKHSHRTGAEIEILHLGCSVAVSGDEDYEDDPS